MASKHKALEKSAKEKHAKRPKMEKGDDDDEDSSSSSDESESISSAGSSNASDQDNQEVRHTEFHLARARSFTMDHIDPYIAKEKFVSCAPNRKISR